MKLFIYIYFFFENKEISFKNGIRKARKKQGSLFPLNFSPKLVILVVILDQTLVHPGAGLAAGSQDEVPGTMVTDPDQLVAHPNHMNLDLQSKYNKN